MKCWRRSSIAVPPRPLIDDRILEAAKVEPLRDPGHGLGMAETDVASRVQGVEEIVHSQETRGIVEIDEDVAAEDDVELSLRRNGCGVDEIGRCELHRFTQVLDQPALTVLTGTEIALDHVRR